ncbi:universal stress protein [Luedemannella flava]|uniref:universal stress protein n=1 Tax=Luedemannella flava TaxID=349316 RepID=UPI0031D344A2
MDDSADGFVVASLAVSEANWRSVGLRVLIPQALRGEESGTVARRVVPPLRSRFPAVDIVVEYVCGPVSDRLIEASSDAAMLAVTRALAGGRHPVLDVWLPDRVLVQARCPVMVPGHGNTGWPTSRGQILVGVDGSDCGAAAARLAFEAAALRRLPLRAITIYCVAPRAHDALLREGQYCAATAQTHAHDLLTASLTPLSQEYPQVPVTAEPMYSPDVPSALIEATGHADLIVLGARGHGPIHSQVLGPVTRCVIDYSQCPVLVAHGVLRAAPLAQGC